MGGLAKTLPPLLVGLAGVGVAVAWFYVSPALAIAVFIVPVLLGLISDQVADSKLRSNDPVGAATWIWGWGFIPFAVAAAGAAAAIIVAVELDPGKASPERKELFSAAAAALGAFIVAMFVKSAEEADEKWIGSRFKKRLRARFRGQLPKKPDGTSSDAEIAVEEEAALGFSGWNGGARKQRSEIVAREL